MKKLKSLLFSAIALSLLASCGGNGNEANKDYQIFISEVTNASSPFETAVEITSLRENNEGFTLNVYRNKEVTLSIKLDDKFKDSTYVIANKSANDEMKKASDEILDDDYFFCFNRIEIVYEDKVVDSIGDKTFEANYIEDGSLIRNELNQKSMESFDPLAWYKVRSGIYTYLGNSDTPLTYDEFKEGPKLTPKYTNEEVKFSDGVTSLGGITEVKVSSTGDGDTTNFIYDATSGISGIKRTRYYLIDTPEIDHGPSSSIQAEPFGEAAKRFTNTRLKNAKHILLQSALGGQLHETYGRMLAFVWYTEKENPEYSDYKLLNYEIVLNGLAHFSTHDKLVQMYDEDILYFSYLEHASELAKKEKLNIRGDEKDPEFNYK